MTPEPTRPRGVTCAFDDMQLETGHVLPQAPWEIHAELRAEQMSR